MRSTDHQSRRLRLAKALKPNLLVKALSGAPALWMLLRDDGSAAMTVHRLFARQCWRDTEYSDRLVLAFGALFMLPALLIAATLYTWRCGARVRAQTGQRAPMQWLEQILVGCRIGVSPPWYYMFEFYRPEARRHAREYLYRSETKNGIYDMLRRRRGCTESTERLRDKAAFAAHCRRHGLPVVQTLAVAREGRFEPDTELPAVDMFFKPIKGAGGRGASRWLAVGTTHYRAGDGTLVTHADLAAHLRALSLQEDYVVRRHLTAHPVIRNLSAGALPTVRLVTCLDENDAPEATHAAFRMPRSPRVVVDNFHAGGIASAVDMVTGALGPATDMGLAADSDWWPTHPTTGAAITNRVLPFWQDAVQLALEAHRLFSDQVAIGWDIALLADGPCLIEGNKSPDLDIIQRTMRAPVGNSRLGMLLAQHITHAFAGPGCPTDWISPPLRICQDLPSAADREVLPMTIEPGAVADTLTIRDTTQLAAASLRAEALETLESGGIIYLPRAGFDLTPAEFSFVSDASATLPTRAEKRSQNGRPTIIYNPRTGRLERSRVRAAQRPQLVALLDRYAQWSTGIINALFPGYREGLVRDRTTYRPCARNATQGLHVDASYGRPTGGQSMLRVFCNINPEQQPRVWRVGETFEPFARRYIASARPKQDGALEKLLYRLGVTKGRRTAYDLLMEDIRGQVKRDRDYQSNAPQKVVDFPAGSAWIALTDLVLHGAVSGQHSLDQTFFVPNAAMNDPNRSSLRILERLTGRSLSAV